MIRRFPLPVSRKAQAQRQSALVTLALLLSACGGGGGDVQTTAPAPPAPSTPTTPTTPPPDSSTPPPTRSAPLPDPSINYDTAEYRRSNGATTINAIAAWNQGSTGKDVTVGIIDSGINSASPEFAGRIHPASLDTLGTRSINDEGGHGTSVAGVLGAARNDSKIMGVAFETTLFIARDDSANSCTTADGCSFDDRNIATGINQAVANGAKVINLSLGGDGISSSLRTALTNAARAGVLVVVAAGNFGSSDDPAAKSNPTLFAQSVVQATNGLAIIAGAIDANGLITDFSYQAGVDANNYLVALGKNVRSFDETGTEYYFSGTSYAAPAVSGAAALLLQAFPNLTARQIVDLLLGSTDDLGAAGDRPPLSGPR